MRANFFELGDGRKPSPIFLRVSSVSSIHSVASQEKNGGTRDYDMHILSAYGLS